MKPKIPARNCELPPNVKAPCVYCIVLLSMLAMMLGIGPIAGQIGPTTPPATGVRFNRDVRPILSTCFRCHGPDESSRRAGLRLDLRNEALRPRTNGTPIVPGKPGESLIVKRIFETDLARIMPPASIHKELSDAQKVTVRRWVEEGAVYEGHWAYQPVERPVVPAAPSSAGATIRTPIDAFIQSRLAQEGLQPSPEAGRTALIRRSR